MASVYWLVAYDKVPRLHLNTYLSVTCIDWLWLQLCTHIVSRYFAHAESELIYIYYIEIMYPLIRVLKILQIKQHYTSFENNLKLTSYLVACSGCRSKLRSKSWTKSSNDAVMVILSEHCLIMVKYYEKLTFLLRKLSLKPGARTQGRDIYCPPRASCTLRTNEWVYTPNAESNQ